MSDITSTQSLVKQVQNGDRDALGELYNRYVARVLTVVRVRLGAELRRKVESWDIVQETMLASLRNIDSFEYASEGAFLNWLTRIVENRIRDHIAYFRAEKRDQRREQRHGRPSSESEELPLQLSGSFPTPSQILSMREDLARLEAALEQLPDDVRDLLVATKLEGRTFVELADEQNSTADAVRMKVNRAMVALTKKFQELESEGVRDG